MGIVALVRTPILLCAVASLASAAGPVVMIVGPPGSGRSTQAEGLQKRLGLARISADELISRNPQKFQKNRIPSLQGVDPHLDPAMNGLVEEALKLTDLPRGVVFDGYP